MSARTFALAAAVAAGLSLHAQPAPPKPDPPIAFTPDEIVWIDAPATLPSGSKMAVLEGNPRAEGTFTMRVRVPAGAAIRPHWHPRHERVTILSGAVDLGFGATADPTATIRYRAGSFYVNPPRMVHYLFFPETTEMQMTGIGPWELIAADGSESTPAAATLTVRSVSPPPGSALTAETRMSVTVDYDVRGFRPSTHFLTLAFEGTTPNMTISPGVVVRAKSDTPPVPPPPQYLEKATGTATLTQELDRVVTHPQIKHPVRVRVYLHEQTGETTSRVIAKSEWIEYR